MIDATIHLQEHPDAEWDLHQYPSGLVVLELKCDGTTRARIWMKLEQAQSLGEFLEFSLQPLPLERVS